MYRGDVVIRRPCCNMNLNLRFCELVLTPLGMRGVVLPSLKTTPAMAGLQLLISAEGKRPFKKGSMELVKHLIHNFPSMQIGCWLRGKNKTRPNICEFGHSKQFFRGWISISLPWIEMHRENISILPKRKIADTAITTYNQDRA